MAVHECNYLTLRSSNTIALKKMVNGVFSTVQSWTLPVTLNRSYHVRLEAAGNRLFVAVDNEAVFGTTDDSLSHGQPALLTYRTQADFDNVMVSPNYLNLMFYDGFDLEASGYWTATGTGTWVEPPEGLPDPGEYIETPDPYAHLRVYKQTTTNNGARVHAGVAFANQIVAATVKPTNTTPTGWFGVMARCVDDGNYYYLKVGTNGVASLRKLVNGAIVELASAPLPVNIGTWYSLQLEVVGTSLRAYVDDKFLMGATDTSHATGKYGLVIHRTAAEFDNVFVSEP